MGIKKERDRERKSERDEEARERGGIKKESGREVERADWTDMVILLVMVSDRLEIKALLKLLSKDTQIVG